MNWRARRDYFGHPALGPSGSLRYAQTRSKSLRAARQYPRESCRRAATLIKARSASFCQTLIVRILQPQTTSRAPCGARCCLARPERLLRASCPRPFGLAALRADSFKIAPGDFVKLLSFEFSSLKQPAGPLAGPAVVWRARRDSNSRPLGS